VTGERPVIALVAHGAHDGGGMERVLAELIRRAHAEFRFVVIARELAPDLRRLVEWRRVPVPARPIPLLFTLFYVFAGLRLVRTRADVVHTVGALVPNRADLASVHFCHAGFRSANHRAVDHREPTLRRINTRVQRSLGLVAERWSYGQGRIPILAAVSSGAARELERFYPTARVLVTPNGVDTARFRPDGDERNELRRAEGVGADEVIALFVGGDWDHKGLSVAIAALARFKGPSPRLWVVGRGDKERFRAYARRCGVAERLSFFGVRSDIERFYQAADVLVLPSRYEAFPLVTLEAAACGIPVIATAVNGVDELVGDQEAGLVAEGTPEAFAYALAQITSDREARTRMGQAARRRACTYSWARSVATVVEIYRELSGATPALVEGRAA
jgi:glycosyltransferase involved in cell wall biosynthesis